MSRACQQHRLPKESLLSVSFLVLYTPFVHAQIWVGTPLIKGCSLASFTLRVTRCHLFCQYLSLLSIYQSRVTFGFFFLVLLFPFTLFCVIFGYPVLVYFGFRIKKIGTQSSLTLSSPINQLSRAFDIALTPSFLYQTITACSHQLYLHF